MQTTFHSTSDRSLGVQHLNFHRDGNHSPSDGEESVVGTMGHHLPALVGHVHIQVLHDRRELLDCACELALFPRLHIKLLVQGFIEKNYEEGANVVEKSGGEYH